MSIGNEENKTNSKREWSFVAYGTSVDLSMDVKTGLPHNGYSGSVEENTLSVWSLNGKGKLVPASTDGLAFYYTKLDAETENFTLEADVIVEQWIFSNGQDGFGVMACDTLGTHGEETSHWNNAYMAAVTKVVYCYDQEKGKLTSDGDQYVMRLGVGALEKRGVTQECLKNGTQAAEFISKMTTLETTAAELNKEPGNYNLVGGYCNEDLQMNDVGAITTFHLSIQRNNTGYVVAYRDWNGNVASQIYYHEENGDALTELEKGTVYVGFFAARNAKIAVRNVELHIMDPKLDAPAEQRPITVVEPSFAIESATCSNSEEYELVCIANFDGMVTVEDCTMPLKAEEKCRIHLPLKNGRNVFDIVATPDSVYCPTAYERLSSYENIVLTHTVDKKRNHGEVLYVSPNGTRDGEGTVNSPLSIHEAVRVAVPGQTILLQEGHYLLDIPLVIERGMNGTVEQRIRMEADKETATRPVLDFQGKCQGMILAANYWYLYGFDITGSQEGKVGLLLAGSHNIVEHVKTYRNGNTGFQLSRYLLHDEWEEWPAHNLVRNCTSYLNADPGYTDSDGFAAKITVAEGNVFDGCISAYNADDGFDLFAKVEHGVTGSVLIRNCLAFKNGYVVNDKGMEKHVGLGIGFKLGGSSFACGHRLENSIAFGNGETGVSSNSAPDVKVKNVISYNNDVNNVAFYTTDAPETSYEARGIISYHSDKMLSERIEARGGQDIKEIYGTTNYYCNGEQCVNTAGHVVTAGWFRSLDMQEAIHGGITRNEDGDICMNGFLELTEEAPESVGVRNITKKA